ncbi:MAG: helix-turn-helix domain-containing protein [Bacillota bacterium]
MISKFKDTAQQILLRTQNQIYIEPSQALRECVAHYTISFANDNNVPDSLTLIPDASGCLVFTYDGFSLTSLLWGATTKTFTIKNDVNNCPMRLFIEFLPGGLFYLTGIKQTDLTDLQIPVWQINARLHSLIADAFESAKNLSNFIDMLNLILLSFMQKRNLPQVLFSAMENIRSHKGFLSVKELANMEFYSDRHLSRLFNDYLGMSVKTFSNIVRINHVLKIINEGHHLPVDFAQTPGFYDQAHFIHTFKAICGVTPKKYLDKMSEFYNEPFKL